ncbi:MAG: heparan-alpha-glucosaminide N-acetyltransferase domain-containing protein [Christensenellaceae bacterium]|nr:heparan-alpha-glucosaminide N-acetyltransferase domain-containing protein [Christensenellaceae bacterium]
MTGKTLDSNTGNPSRKASRRIWELDFIRGFLIILMLIDHLLMTVDYFFGPEWVRLSAGAANGFTRFFAAADFYMTHPAREVIHPVVVLLFITLCGLSTGFSRNIMKRACTLSFISIGITTVTAAINISGMYISFGIIHLLTVCVATWAIVNLITKRNKYANLFAGLALGLVVTALTMAVTFNENLMRKIGNDGFVFVFNDATFDRSPGDFWPLIPWSGIFFFAAALSSFLYADKKSLLPSLDGKWNKPFCFVGRHTLIVYVFHLIVLVAVLEIISYGKFGKWLFIDLF